MTTRINTRPTPELLSTDVQEIINYRPHWFIRKGNTLFIGILGVLILMSFLIEYPDSVKTSVRLSALNAPKMVETKTGGKLEKLLITNGQEVKKGQPLAYIQSTGNYAEMGKLKEWILQVEELVETGKLETIINKTLPPLTELGEIQGAYQDFQVSFNEIQQLYANGYYQRKKNALVKDLKYISELKNDAYKRRELHIKDQSLQQTEYEAYEKLAKEKVIAPLELNQYKSKLIAKEQSLSQTETQLTNSDINTHNKRKELLELEKVVLDQQQQFQSSFFSLKNKLEEWMQRYVLAAPESGLLEFVTFLQENQLLDPGQQLFFIQQPNENYYGEMWAGQSGIGKIKNGQKVIIKLAGYPTSEYGQIEGRVSYISNLPSERDSFLIRVDLPKGLQTNYNKYIQFRNNLSAVAEVITDDRKLIDRLFGQMKTIWK